MTDNRFDELAVSVAVAVIVVMFAVARIHHMLNL